MKSDSSHSAPSGTKDPHFSSGGSPEYSDLDPAAILSQGEWSPTDKIQALLRFGVKKTDLEIGYLSHVDAGLRTLSIVETSGPDPTLDDGSSYELAETFERRAITSPRPLEIPDCTGHEWEDDPAHSHFGFFAYIAQKIVVDEQLYGAVSFASRSRRKPSFGEAETVALKRVSDGIEQVLTTPCGAVSNSRLVEQLDLLRRVQQVSKVGGWELHVESDTLTWTDQTYRIHELSADFEPELESALAFYPGDDRSRIENALHRCLHHGVPFDETVQLITAEGNRRTVRARGAPYRTNGTITHITGTIQDVSEQVRLEGELELQRNQFRKLVEHAEPMVFMLDANGEVLMAEGDTVALFGREPGENVGESIYDFFEEVPEIQSGLEQALNGEPVERTVNYRGRTLDLRTAPFEDKTGATAGCIGIVADITEKIVMQRELNEERDLLRRVFQTSPSAIAIINENGRFVRVSDRAQEILGLEKDEVTNRTYNDPDWHITTAEGEPIPDEELPFARVRDEEEPVIGLEIAVGPPDGDRRILSVSGAPLHDDSGNFLGGVFHIDDITYQRNAKLSLQESEARFRGVFDNSALGIGLVDERGCLIQANPALKSMLGCPENSGELEGSKFENFTHSEDLEADRNQFEELVNGTREEYRTEKRYVRRNGEVFWGHLTVSRLKSPGEVEFIGVVEDIDDRKAKEKELRLFRKAVTQAKEAALILAEDPRRAPGPTIEYANPAFSELTGHAAGNAEGSNLKVLFGPDTDSDTMTGLWNALEEGREHGGEVIMYKADGTPFVSRWSIAPVRNEEQSITHWVAVLRDITDKRETGRRLLEVQDAERRRIDKEMHDQMGGLLTALQMTVDLARIEIRESGGPTAPLDKIEDRVSDLASVTRTISRRLHPQVLVDEGLGEACLDLFDQLNDQFDLAIEHRLDVDGEEPLSTLVEMTAYCVVQESLLYAVRTTDAKRLRVVVELEDEALHFQLHIDGASLDATLSGEDQPLPLRQVQRTVDRLDGAFTATSTPTSTEVDIRLPLEISCLPSK